MTSFILPPDNIVAGQSGHISHHNEISDDLLILRGPPPSGDTSGVTDTGAIQALLNAGQSVRLAAGSYYCTNLTVPPTLGLSGSGPATIITAASTGACISMHGTAAPGGGFGVLTDAMFGGYLRDFLVDGTGHPTGASYGVEIGDAWGYNVQNVKIVHFNQASDIGFRAINNVFWTEKCIFDVHAFDCTTAIMHDIGAGQPSYEYNDMRYCVLCNAGQNGLVLQNGAYFSGCSLTMRGNFNSSTSATVQSAAVMTFTGSGGGHNSSIQHSLIDCVVEVNNSHTYGPQTINFGAGANFLQRNAGVLVFQDSPWTNSNGTTNVANFSGVVRGDSVLVAAAGPAAPVHYQPANPPTTAATSPVMAGFGTTPTSFTPQSSGNVIVTMSGAAYTATATAELSIGAWYGSGTAPSNGTPQGSIASTRFGAASNYNLQAAGIGGTANSAWSFTDSLSLSLNNAYWFDAAYSTSVAGDQAALRNVGITIYELPLYQ